MRLLQPYIEEMTWQEARQHLRSVEPELTKIIDNLSPGKNFTLLKVAYSFGSKIFDKAVLRLPIGGNNTVPLSHSEIPHKIQEALCYSSLPLGCIINNHGAEIYRDLKDKLHSVAFCNKGLCLGIWEFFSPSTPFSISAGARSLIMLPKIADRIAHGFLNPYDIHLQPPTSPYEHWKIFRKMSASKKFTTPWYSELIFFTSSWAQKIRKDSAWEKLRFFLLQRCWEQTEDSRNRFLYDEMWESFFRILSSRKIRPISYILDLFMYLVYLAQGKKLVAYRPASGSESAGPINEILRIYLETYKLKTYVPTLMLPSHFDDDPKHPIYYSLQIPTYWDSAPLSRNSVSVKRDLEYLIWVMDTFKRELNKGTLQLTIPAMGNIFEKVNFDFFHSDGNINERIKPSSTMPEEDANLLYMPKGNIDYGERIFVSRCTFTRACVRLSSKLK